METIKKIDSVCEFISAHNKGTFGVWAITVTDCDKSFRKGTKANRNQYLGRVLKATFVKNAILGISYEGALKGAAKRSDVENFEYQVSKLPWGEWKQYPYIISHKEKDYLRLFSNKATVFKSVYFIDGREATESEVIEIKQWLPERKASSKQLESGITEDEAITPLTYCFDSILLLQQGEKQYMQNNLLSVSLDWIKTKFKQL